MYPVASHDRVGRDWRNGVQFFWSESKVTKLATDPLCWTKILHNAMVKGGVDKSKRSAPRALNTPLLSTPVPAVSLQLADFEVLWKVSIQCQFRSVGALRLKEFERERERELWRSSLNVCPYLSLCDSRGRLCFLRGRLRLGS